MTTPESRPAAAPAWGLLLAVAGAKLAVHLALANRYGYFPACPWRMQAALSEGRTHT